jgi:hypothetical protein
MDTNKKLDFDLADDVVFFVNNDNTFYRKYAFPFITKFVAAYRKGKKPSISFFKPLSDTAYNAYKERYPDDRLPDTIPDSLCHEICNKLYSQEYAHLKQKKDGKSLPESIDRLCENVNNFIGGSL